MFIPASHGNFAVNMLLGTSFINRFIRRISMSERKEAVWRMPPVAILINPKPNYSFKAIQQTHRNPDQSESEAERTFIALVARKPVLISRTRHHVMVTTDSCRLKIFEPRLFSTGRRCTVTAKEIMNRNPDQLFYVLISNAFARFDSQSAWISLRQWNPQNNYACHIHGRSRNFSNRDPRENCSFQIECFWRHTYFTNLSIGRRISSSVGREGTSRTPKFHVKSLYVMPPHRKCKSGKKMAIYLLSTRHIVINLQT